LLPGNIFNKDNSQADYYKRKLLFLSKHCDLNEEVKKYSISGDEVEKSFFTSNQISFELPSRATCNAVIVVIPTSMSIKGLPIRT
jgi:hypothetical protein